LRWSEQTIRTGEDTVQIIKAGALTPTGTDGNAAGPVATPSTGATGVSVIRQRQIPGGIGPHHHHDREEVVLLLAGSIAIHAGDERSDLHPGDAAVLPAGLIHRVETLGTEPAEWLLVAPAGVGFFGTDGQRVTPPWAA
jgi:quercetin dioxygenase-like cupin family protein